MGEMNNNFVTVEIAKRMRELGFSQECLIGYNEKLNVYRHKFASSNSGDYVSWEKYDQDVPIPLITQAVEWIVEKYAILVSLQGKTGDWAYYLDDLNHDFIYYDYRVGEFDNINEATLAGIEKVLTDAL